MSGKRLDGRITLVTGASRGIGRAVARRFAAEGAQLVLVARTSGGLEEVDDEIRASGAGHAMLVPLDLCNGELVDQLGAALHERFGRLDLLFNNAGIGQGFVPPEEFTLEDFNRVMMTNLGSCFLGLKYVTPIMKKQGGGSIINTGSIAGVTAGRGPVIYSAAKAAVVQLSCSVAMELGEDGVRVNTISPGGIATGIFGKVMGLDDEAAEGTVEAVKVGLAALQPIPRSGLPDDIAQAAVFLASPAASYISGTNLKVDGALTRGVQF